VRMMNWKVMSGVLCPAKRELLARCTPSWPRFAVFNDRMKQFFECRRGVINLEKLALMPLDYCLDFRFAPITQTRSANLRLFSDLEQRIDPAQLFQLALMQNRDPITDVLYIS